jgi:ribulose-phosphate 3-epimerase
MTTETDRIKCRARGISLGIFASDSGGLRHAAVTAASWGCEILHFDVMDGVFTPQMTGGPGFIKALDVGLLRDVHLMIQNPARHVASYVQAGADIIIVHAEATGAAEALAAIRAAAKTAGRAVLAGIGLMPGTRPDDVADLFDLGLDAVLVLSLDPRSAEPPDITGACSRLSALRRRYGPKGPILVFDGGVTFDSIDEIAACQPDMIVSGSAILAAKDPETAFRAMSAAGGT